MNEYEDCFLKEEVPLLIVLGQSNAHGHACFLPESLKITEPLPNVWGLGQKENQFFGLTDVVFKNFVSYGMNLGETQDHTYCVITEFARMWQQKIDAGEKLPDLYTIQISVGGQGIAEYEVNENNMWYPDRDRVLQQGSLQNVCISLYPLALEILNLAVKHLKKKGKVPKLIGLHWNQWETEADTGVLSVLHAKQNYDRFFSGIRKALEIPCPIFLYRPLSDVYKNPEAVELLTKLFLDYEKTGLDYYVLDISKSALFHANTPEKGIFQDDCVHYNASAHLWFAEQQWQWIHL